MSDTDDDEDDDDEEDVDDNGESALSLAEMFSLKTRVKSKSASKPKPARLSIPKTSTDNREPSISALSAIISGDPSSSKAKAAAASGVRVSPPPRVSTPGKVSSGYALEIVAESRGSPAAAAVAVHGKATPLCVVDLFRESSDEEDCCTLEDVRTVCLLFVIVLICLVFFLRIEPCCRESVKAIQ